jgi:hypothetical protein
MPQQQQPSQDQPPLPPPPPPQQPSSPAAPGVRPVPSALDAASVIGLSAQGTGAWGERKFEARDVARSLLIMISNNIGQLAYLNALKFKCKCVAGGREGKEMCDA